MEDALENYNIASGLVDMARRAPYRPGIVFPAGRDRNGRSKNLQWSFDQLNELCDRYAHGLSDYGVEKGERALMMVRPSIDLIAVAFALIKIGAAPVLIDPGMGRKAFLQCVSEAEPTTMIGIPLAHIIRRVFPKPFRTIKRAVTAGDRKFGADTLLKNIRSDRRDSFPIAPTTTEDEAAIAFTSGGTGIPKGVVYLHGIFRAQIRVMQQDMNVAPGEVHLSAVYIFALFNPALGVTTVIPDMNPRKTAQVNPAYLVEAIQTHGVTMSLGSPIIWKRVNEYCRSEKIRLPSLKHIFMFGAAVSPNLVREFSDIVENGKIYTPYGATEALPLTLIDEREIIEETQSLTEQGAGVCVGRPIGGLSARIIQISDESISEWNESLSLPPNEIGEIVVRGDVVTRAYLNRPKQTKLSKIKDNRGGIWHRMGDIGYLDDQGRLWICGRKSHRVETSQGMLLPIPCEAIFNQHPAVARTALVGVGEYGRQRPILIVELKRKEGATRKQVTKELLEIGEKYEHTQQIKTLLFHNSFPVDVRHNTKILRENLAIWASKKI